MIRVFFRDKALMSLCVRVVWFAWTYGVRSKTICVEFGDENIILFKSQMWTLNTDGVIGANLVEGKSCLVVGKN